MLAREAGVGLLVLTHLSSRCIPREVREEASAVFEHVAVARDFDRIEVPFPERGPAIVEPYRRRRDPVEVADDRGTVGALDL